MTWLLRAISRFSGYGERGNDRGNRVLPETTFEQHSDPWFEPDVFYWVPEAEVERRLSEMFWDRGWLMGWRDITAATNERTFVASVIPRTANGDKFLLMFPKHEARLCAALLANLSSLATDFVARQKIGGVSFKLYLIRQMPVFPPWFYTEPRLAFIVPKVLELTFTSHSLTPFARDLGYDGPPFAWDEERRAVLRAVLDAFYARAYGLARDQLRYILDPADVRGRDYPSETFRVLKEKEIRQFGEYRTRRLVLEAWDRMEAHGEFKGMGM
jgi:hypothetical protein